MIFGAEQAEDFQFGATIDGKDQGSSSVASNLGEGDGKLSIENTDTGCIIKGNLPMYDIDGLPIIIISSTRANKVAKTTTRFLMTILHLKATAVQRMRCM